MKVLHLLYQSLPNISGSSVRSRSIINAQKTIGLSPIVITSPFQSGVKVNHGWEELDQIRYYRCYIDQASFRLGSKKNFFIRIMKFMTLFKYFVTVYKIARDENADLIHSHAMFYNALPGIIAAKLLRIPHVYEIRSDWAQNSHFKSSVFVRKLMSSLEKLCVRLSSGLVVISQGLMTLYGGYTKKSILIGNAVDDDLLDSQKDTHIKSLSLPIHIGYIGSVIPLEGIEYILKALKNFDESQIIFTVAGGGESLALLKELKEQYGFSDNYVRFIGKVAHGKIPSIYKEIDVIINYRRDEPVAHSVTPLKPLEAMAYKKLVIVSDVRGMTELVSHMSNGIVVKSDCPSELVKLFQSIIENPKFYIQLRINGYEFVSKKKSWNQNAKKYQLFYEDLLG